MQMNTDIYQSRRLIISNCLAGINACIIKRCSIPNLPILECWCALKVNNKDLSSHSSVCIYQSQLKPYFLSAWRHYSCVLKMLLCHVMWLRRVPYFHLLFRFPFRHFTNLRSLCTEIAAVSQNWEIWVGNDTIWILFFHSFPASSLRIFHSHPLKI